MLAIVTRLKTRLVHRLLAGMACLGTLLPVSAQVDYTGFPYPALTVTELATINGPEHSRDTVRAIVAGPSNRVYFFGESTTIGGETAFFIHCYNANGSLAWQVRQTENGLSPLDLLVDASGNAYVVANVANASIGLAGALDFYLGKYTSAGAEVFRRKYNYTEPALTTTYAENSAKAASFTPDGNLLITGHVGPGTEGQVTIETHPVMIKINTATGDTLWTSPIHGAGSGAVPAYESPVGLAVDASGSAFEVSSHGQGGDHLSLRKVNSAGENVFSGSGHVTLPATTEQGFIAKGVATDLKGDVYVIGTVLDENFSRSAFVAKFKGGDGAFLWRTNLPNGQDPLSIKRAPDGNMVLAVNTGSVSGSQGMVYTIDTNGDEVWSLAFVGPSTLQDGLFYQDKIVAFNLDASGNVYVSGTIVNSSQQMKLAVAKLGSAGEIRLFRTIDSDTSYEVEDFSADQNTSRRIAATGDGMIYTSTQRKYSTATSPISGRVFKTYDAVLLKLAPEPVSVPVVRLASPTNGLTRFKGGFDPVRFEVDVGSASGIQRVDYYNDAGKIGTSTEGPGFVLERILSGSGEFRIRAVAFGANELANFSGPARINIRQAIDSEFSFTQNSYTFSESAGRVAISVTRSANDMDEEVMIVPAPGTASNNDLDSQAPFPFYDSAYLVSFTGGALQSDLFVFKIIDDKVAEADETFLLKLPNGKVATVTISDDDGPPKKTIAAWLASNFTATERANPNISGDQADPDQDFLVNLEEFLLGTDPKVKNTVGRPEFQLLFKALQPFVRLQYTQLISTEAEIFVEESKDFLAWVCGDCGIRTVTPKGDGTETVVVDSPATFPMQFFRVNARRK